MTAVEYVFVLTAVSVSVKVAIFCKNRIPMNVVTFLCLSAWFGRKSSSFASLIIFLCILSVMLVLAWLHFTALFSIFNAPVSKVNKAFSASYCAAPKGCDLIVYSGTTDPTEHLGCMIHVSVFLWSAGLSIELVAKLVFRLSYYFFFLLLHTRTYW